MRPFLLRKLARRGRRGRLNVLWLVVLLCAAPSRGATAAAGAAPDALDLSLPAQDAHAFGVTFETVAPGVVESSIATLGTVAFDDQRVVRVYSPVSGLVERVIAPLGAQVGLNAPLAVLSSADLASARADLERASAALRHAHEEASRQSLLFRQRAASARDFEAAKDSLRRAEAERARAAQQAKLLTGTKGPVTQPNFTLRSPLVGEVVARTIGLGTQVRGQYQGSNAPPLFTIADLDSVWLLLELHEADIPRVRRGARAFVQEGGPKERGHGALAEPSAAQAPLEGTVDYVGEVVDPNAHTLEARCSVDNRRRRLRPGMRVVVDLAGEKNGVLSVEANSIVRVGRQPFVFVRRAQTDQGAELRLRPLELADDGDDPDDAEEARQPQPAARTDADGQPLPRRLVVRHGLAAGEVVVRHGAAALFAQWTQRQATHEGAEP